MKHCEMVQLSQPRLEVMRVQLYSSTSVWFACTHKVLSPAVSILYCFYFLYIMCMLITLTIVKNVVGTDIYIGMKEYTHIMTGVCHIK